MKNNNFFSKTYKQAREKFLDAVSKKNLKLQSYINPNLGINQEELSIDVCFINPNKEKTFLITSGCHGIEGYAGSGLQLYILENLENIQPILEEKNISIVLAHAINPWGFSWGRRVTEEGVDLNRNFLNWNNPLPENYFYDLLHEHLVPWVWPYEYANVKIREFNSTFGSKKLQDVMTLGQYKYPKGLFYGGDKATWCNVKINEIINSISFTDNLLWLDIHTGLGKPGEAEILHAWNDTLIEEKSKLIWPNMIVTEIGATGSSTSKIHGGMHEFFIPMFDKKSYVGILYEIGTVPPIETATALRSEQAIWNNEAQKDLWWLHHTRPYLRSVMYPEKTIWYDRIINQWEKVFFTALRNF